MSQRIEDIDFSCFKTIEDFEEYISGQLRPIKSLSEELNVILLKHGLSRKNVIKDSLLNETFGYQIFMGLEILLEIKLSPWHLV